MSQLIYASYLVTVGVNGYVASLGVYKNPTPEVSDFYVVIDVVAVRREIR